MTTEKQVNKKWTDELEQELTQIVGDSQDVVSAEAVMAAAKMLDITERRISAKLRNMGREVASLAKSKAPTFTEEETQELSHVLQTNPGAFTFKEISEQFAGGKFTAKEIQGKVLHLDMTSLVKPTEHVQVEKKFTDAEEALIIDMATQGKSLEDIAEAIDMPMKSIRGKTLSLLSAGKITKIPRQAECLAKETVDPIEALGAGIADMTVAEIAQATNKSERGIKTTLTRRAIKVKDYNGAQKHEKAEQKRKTA